MCKMTSDHDGYYEENKQVVNKSLSRELTFGTGAKEGASPFEQIYPPCCRQGEWEGE